MEKRKSIFKLSRSQWISVAVLASSLGVAIAVTVPNTFTAGTTISASQVNANFAALATGSVSVSGVSLIQEIDNDTSATGGCNSSRGSFFLFYTGGNNCDAMGPISLPDGVTVTSLGCAILDNSAVAGAAIFMTLQRVDLATGAFTSVFQTAASVDSAAVQVLTDSTATASTAVVDNSAFSYFLWADFGTADLSTVGSNLRLLGCKVAYQP